MSSGRQIRGSRFFARSAPEVALGVGPEEYGIDLRSRESRVTLHEGEPVEAEKILATPRIGISKGVETM